MEKHKDWFMDKDANRWEMPCAPTWKRLPIIRHLRAIVLKFKVEKHYSSGIGAFGLRTGYDDWVLYGIWHGLERKIAEYGKDRNKGNHRMKTHSIAEHVRQRILHSGSLKSISNVVTAEGSSFNAVSDTGSTSIPLHELSALPKVSQRMMHDSAFDVEGWLADRIADKFSRAEAAAFINGDGVDKPRGFLNHAAVEESAWSWGSLGYIATGEDGDFPGAGTADVIVDLVYALGARYRANASFVMNSKTAGAVRKMKDADGRFLWSDGLAAGEPARLMGYPVLIAKDMPDIASGGMAIAFGDFNAGYTIAESPDLRIGRDPLSAKPHVLFPATKRVGGDVTDFAAIKLLKFSRS